MSLALVLFIVFLGTLGQATFGFGGGLIAIPLLSLIIGERLHHAINEVYYRRSIEALLAISVISLIGVSV